MKHKLWLIFVGFFLSAPPVALAESESLLDTYQDKIRARFDVGNGGTFSSFDGTEVGYWSLPGEGRPIVFVTGLGETFVQYRETTWDLRTLERPIHIMELRSQGHGDRLSTESRQVYHVDSFEDYAKDFETFVRQQIEPEEPFDLIAHSTGAYAAIRYAAENPSAVRQLILIAPLLRVELGSIPVWLAKITAHAMCLIGRCDNYVLNRSDYEPGIFTFEKNDLTHSEVRFNQVIEIMEANPELRSGGVSNRWLLEAFKVPNVLMPLAGQIKLPVLMLTADHDHYAKVPEQKDFCDTASRCRQVVFENSRHVLLQETDRVRNALVEELITALSRR